MGALLWYIYIYIYAFSRHFYPKRLTVHSGYTFFCQYMLFPGWWRKMVALGELLELPVVIFTTTQLWIDNTENKILIWGIVPTM